MAPTIATTAHISAKNRPTLAFFEHFFHSWMFQSLAALHQWESQISYATRTPSVLKPVPRATATRLRKNCTFGLLLFPYGDNSNQTVLRSLKFSIYYIMLLIPVFHFYLYLHNHGLVVVDQEFPRVVRSNEWNKIIKISCFCKQITFSDNIAL